MDFLLSIPNEFALSKIFYKRGDSDFDIEDCPFVDGDSPGSTSYEVYISQFTRFARSSTHVTDFNARNINLTANSPNRLFARVNFEKLFQNVIADTID